MFMQLCGAPLPQLCHSETARQRDLSAPKSAKNGDQRAGTSSDVQEHTASLGPATVTLVESCPARADSVVTTKAHSRCVPRNRCFDGEAEDSIGVSPQCHSTSGFTTLGEGGVKAEQSQAPYVHGSSEQAVSSRATERFSSHSDSSLRESTQRSINDINLLRERRKKLKLLAEEAASAESMPAKALNDGGSRPEPETARHGQPAQGEQHSGSEASVGEGTAVHQEELTAGSSSLQSEQTCNARGIAIERVLLEPIPQDLQECPTMDSASTCPSFASDTQQRRSCNLEWPIRDAGQEQNVDQSIQEGKHDGDATGQQRRLTDVTLNLAIAVSMVIGLIAVLLCGLFMLASTYMSINM